jgi:signal transduction histidine kinase
VAAKAGPARDQAIDVLVELLGERDQGIESPEFYERLCAAICQLTSVTRAALLLYDPAYRAVRAAGTHGVSGDLAARLEGTLDETPIARRALTEDDVVVASGDLADQVPERFAELAGVRAIACVPVAAGGNWLGVIFADRGGEQFSLTVADRRTMRTLGRLAALVASVERVTEQRERAHRLSDRIALTREIHERVIQRMFGLMLVLGADGELPAPHRRRAHEEVREVMAELRGALDRSLAPQERETKITLRRLLRRLELAEPRLRVDWKDGNRVPARLEGLTQGVLTEALRNTEKHADAEEILVTVENGGGALSLEVTNDGAADVTPDREGLGLRLAALEALQHEGVVEYGPLGDGRWHLRLVCPIGDGGG